MRRPRRTMSVCTRKQSTEKTINKTKVLEEIAKDDEAILKNPNVEENYLSRAFLNYLLDNIKEANTLTLINMRHQYILVVSKEEIITDGKIVGKFLFHELKEKVVQILNGGL